MISRFEGDNGKRLRIEAFASQKIIAGNRALAEELANSAQLVEVKIGTILIEQEGTDNDVYFILTGIFDVVVINGRVIAQRGPGETVGEMAAVEPIQKRSASIIAADAGVVAKLTEPAFAELASRYPQLWFHLAKDLARRLMQRNILIRSTHDRIRVFIISSAEALPIARQVQVALQHDPFTVVVWTDGVFKVAHYTLESLEEEVERSDFAIAIAHSDDITESRETTWPAPRDNVILELGLFIGKLGRARAILMEPRKERVKLPSDLAGVMTIPYRFEKGQDALALMGSACNTLREHINWLGPNNY